MAESGQSFTTMTRGQKACVPVLILWPVVVFYFPGELTNWLTVPVYLIVGFVTRCLLLCFVTLIGAIFGLVLAPAVNGSALSDISHLAAGVVAGLLIGLILQEAERIRHQKNDELP